MWTDAQQAAIDIKKAVYWYLQRPEAERPQYWSRE